MAANTNMGAPSTSSGDFSSNSSNTETYSRKPRRTKSLSYLGANDYTPGEIRRIKERLLRYYTIVTVINIVALSWKVTK